MMGRDLLRKLLGRFLGEVLAVGLVGCTAVSPTTQVLTLQPSLTSIGSIGAHRSSTTPPQLVAVSVTVPDALDRRALTVRQDDTRYRIDERYRWSLPFADEVREALLVRMQLRYPALRFVHSAALGAADAKWQLQFVFTHFEADERGTATAQGRCILREGNAPIWERTVSFQGPAERTPTGYATALQRLLDQVVEMCALPQPDAK
ncbi:MAG: membrane integrity-associated transporter subunit PqiC [Hydrogenophilus thermoluteolus]